MLAVYPLQLIMATPAYVRVEYKDGDTEEILFPTRRDAETFIYLIPYAQVHSESEYWQEIAAAKLVPALFGLN